MQATQTTPNTSLDHLEGMPPYLMMQMEERIAERLKGYTKRDSRSVFSTEGDYRGEEWFYRPIEDDERAELARHILRRMMFKRMEGGKQFDSILESSRKYFAEAMMATAMETK